MLADYHIHTKHSCDSHCPMEAMVQQALKIGLDEITFTEHVDYDAPTPFDCDYDAYFAELAKMREKYGAKLCIKTGIEFGMQTHTVERYQRDAAQYPFDFIILSVHHIDNLRLADNEFQRGKSQEFCHQTYYQTIYELTQRFSDYSVLGHLDYIKRYDMGKPYPDEQIMDIAEKIFKKIIADGKGIEVNTSCYKMGMPDLTPSRRILKRYRELGGEIVTIGSDTHDTRYLGDHMIEVQDILKQLGFSYFCTFTDRQPCFHRL